MRRRRAAGGKPDAFAIVRELGLALPGVTAATRYDGAPVLKRGGAFMAALAMDPAAEPDTLIVRCAAEDRQYLLDEAPETYYLTDDHQKHPVVLVRLSRIDREALRDLLATSWRLTAAKARRPRAISHRDRPAAAGRRVRSRSDRFRD